MELPDEQFVLAVAARLPEGSGIDSEIGRPSAAERGPTTPADLHDARILVTGATGQVALPVALGWPPRTR